MNPNDNGGSAQDNHRWEGLPLLDPSHMRSQQADDNDFETFEYIEFSEFEDSTRAPFHTGLHDAATESWEEDTNVPDVAPPPWNPVMTFRPSPAPQYQTASSRPVMQSPAVAATYTLESPPITTSGKGRGKQTVFRGVAGVPRGSKQHPSEVWESHRVEIRRLYIEQQKTLRQVVDLMAHKGFHASPKMYKDRFAQWNFNKNSKKKTTGAQNLGKPKRAAQDAVSLKVEAAIKRHPVLIKSEDLLAAGLAVYEDHRLLAWMTSPDSPRFREQFVSGMRELSRRHYGLDHRLNQGVVPFLTHILSESRKRVNDLIEASWFFSQREFEKGRNWAWKAFEMLLDFLQDQNFYSLLYLFISIPRWKDSGLMLKVLNCLDTNASMIMGPNHRLAVLFKQMHDFYRSHGPDEFASVISDAMKGVFKVIDDMGNVDDYCVTWLKCDYAWTCDLDEIWVNGLLHEVMSLRNSLQGGLRDDELKAWAHAMYLHLQVIREMEGDGSKLTFDVADEIERSLESSHCTDGIYAIQALCFRTMAQYHRSLCTMQNPPSDPRHGLARHCLKRATDYDERHWGLGPRIVISDLKRLEAWNREAERWEEVEAAKVKWVEGMWMNSSNTWTK